MSTLIMRTKKKKVVDITGKIAEILENHEAENALVFASSLN